MRPLLSTFLLLFLSIVHISTSQNLTTAETCSPVDVFLLRTSPSFSSEAPSSPPPLYILYDVNPVEGFNLRRDVYIRMAVFIKTLKETTYPNVRLVLPPFSELFHWRSRNLNQKHIFWSQFFDLESLKLYTDVIDMWEFWDEVKPYLKSTSDDVLIDEVYKLKHYKDMFENGVFVDKFERTKCAQTEQGIHGPYLGYHNFTAKKVSCVNFQGAAGLLKDVLKKFEPKRQEKPRIVLFLNAEIVLHDHWGNSDFWKCRRSMRFSRRLIDKANDFRVENFNSTDRLDGVELPTKWVDETDRPRKMKGGDYICAHLRRGDFVYGREKTTPTLRSASGQIKKLAKQLSLDQVFLASDCSRAELMDLLSFMKRLRVYKYIPHVEDGEAPLKDGEVAIIDQIICSKARYFIGTYESTFTYRIYEEREIFGFPTQTTFNTFCKNENSSDCERNSIWPIVY